MNQYLLVAGLLGELTAELQRLERWQAEHPGAEALASELPFCVDTLSFDQWLQFVLIPRMEQLVLLQAPDALWEALLAREWTRLFVDLRPLWAQARLIGFGHALLEKLVTPYKSITAHVYAVPVPMGLEGDPAWDAWLAETLSAERLRHKPFTPLPVLGVPGWWAGTEAVAAAGAGAATATVGAATGAGAGAAAATGAAAGAALARRRHGSAHHSGRLSASIRSCSSVLAFRRDRHLNQWRRVKGSRRRTSGTSPDGCRITSAGRWPIS